MFLRGHPLANQPVSSVFCNSGANVTHKNISVIPDSQLAKSTFSGIDEALSTGNCPVCAPAPPVKTGN